MPSIYEEKNNNMKILSVVSFIREFFRITWYSVSSQKFYPDLYKNYKGFGVKYIATIISFTSIIYVILAYSNVLIVRNYLEQGGDEDNPIEYIIRQWPEISYSAGSISWDEEEPLLINNSSGKTVIAIDPDGKINAKKSSKIPIVLKSKNILISIEDMDDKKSAGPKEMSLGYKKVFGKEDLLINSDTLRDKLVSLIDSINIFILILLVPLIISVRLALHIFSNLFSILLFYVIFLWLGLRPTLKSATRIILFTGGAAEIAHVILALIYPQLVSISSMVEYWAIILAIYSITKTYRPIKGKV